MRVIAARPKAGTKGNQEAELAEFVRKLAGDLAGWRAVHVHLSQLQLQNRYRQHLSIAASSFDALLKKLQGAVFVLRNHDLVALVKNATPEQLDDVVMKMRYLFSDDPLTLGDSEGKSRFCNWYILEKDYESLRALTQDMADASAKPLAKPAPPPAAGAAPAPPASSAPPAEAAPETAFDSAQLAKLEHAATRLDFAKYIRRQSICALVPGSKPEAVYNEIYLSIADIRRATIPGVDITSNRWLFQYFTETLDRNLLRLLPELEHKNPTPCSINVNVATLLSPFFQAFDARFRALTQKKMVFELQTMDVYADIGGYLFARDFVRERGYRLCLDGLSPLTFPLIQRDQLGLDLEKIVWAPAIDRDTTEERRQVLRRAIIEAGPSRVILCRCDDQRAIDFGHSVGITLFQGRHLDRLLAAAPKA
jgi:hypothetical protein